MATILKFRAGVQVNTTKKPGRRKRRSAEIVIFPGVRVERWQGDTDLAGDSRRQPPRDMLELISH